MKRALRWVRRIVLGVVAFAIFLVAVAIGAIHTSWGRDRIRVEIVAALQAELPGSTIGSLEGSPFGTLVLRDVTLMARDGKPLVTVAELRVRASLRPLLERQIHVDEVSARGVAVFVREQPSEPAKAPASGTPSEPSRWTVHLPAIAVDDASVTVETGSGVETIEAIAIRAAATIAGDGHVAASANARATWRGHSLEASAHAFVDDTIRVPFAIASLDGASVIATNITVADAISGTIRARIPTALAAEQAGIALPSEVPAVVTLTASGGRDGAFAVHADGGAIRADALATVDLDALRVRGVVDGAAPELGLQRITAAVDATPDRARGIAVLSGHRDEIAGHSTLAFDTTPTAVDAVAVAAVSRGAARASAIVHARGPLVPAPQLDVAAQVSARGYRDRTVEVSALDAEVTGRVTPERQTVDAHVRATNIISGTTRVRAASLAARIDRNGDTLTAELGAHRVVAPDGAPWSGAGGRVVVTPDAIAITDVRTSTRGSELVATARIGRHDDRLVARARARNVKLALADPTLRGTASADIDVSRARGSWRGRARVQARDAGVPGRPAVDADVTVALAGRTVDATATVTSREVGTAAIQATVRGPRDLTDARAWQALPRDAIEQLAVQLRDIDGAPLGVRGRVAGELVLRGASEAGGDLQVRGVSTPAGDIDADVTVAAVDASTVVVGATVRAPQLAAITAHATLALPARPFDPRAWTQLGRGALRGATLRTNRQRVDAALLARFGVVSPYAADLDATLTVGPAAATSSLVATIGGLRGGLLTTPVDATLTATTDAGGTRATLDARAGLLAAKATATTSLTIDGALAGRARTTPIDASLTIPDVAARDLLALLGETDVLSGRIGGSVTFRGTIAAPDVRARIAAHDVSLRPGLSGRKPPRLDSLTLDAKWTPSNASVELVSYEGDRLLKVTARGNPLLPRSINASIEAANFDIAPLVAFAPGQLRAARGTLNAALRIRGLDPKTGSIRGKLAIKDGRFPLSPELGTLRRATVEVDVVGNQLVATFDGRLGAGGGNAKGTLTAEISGGMPMAAHLDMKLAKVSPIGALQPIIDADLVGDWTNHGEQWRGTLRVRNGNIVVPPETGNDLLITGAPSDMIFIDRARVKRRGRRPPMNPWLVTSVVIGNTDVDVQDADFRVKVTARGRLEVAVGDGLGVNGLITTTRGTVELLGRRYRVENAALDFVGTTDPRLDIRIVRDFKNMTLTVDVGGTSELPDVRLSSDPGIYTQGQLMSFLAGADPGDADSTQQSNQAVASAGLSMLSGRIGQRVNKHLPFKFDSINYEAGTTASSQAVRFGVQLGEKSYLVWRQRLAARPDENPGEAVFEYQFRKNLLFEGTIGERAKGGDFLWRKRW